MQHYQALDPMLATAIFCSAFKAVNVLADHYGVHREASAMKYITPYMHTVIDARQDMTAQQRFFK